MQVLDKVVSIVQAKQASGDAVDAAASVSAWCMLLSEVLSEVNSSCEAAGALVVPML
jgi:hypothetical protein